jgi:hypothetical protein
MNLTSFLFIVVFLIGLYFYAKNADPKNADPKNAEGLINGNSDNSKCPNLLIQKGSRFYLYNSKKAQVPGVNPIEFDNLEDYTEFLDWQRSQGVRCPVLYLQESYDPQGNRVYKIRPSVSEPQGGLPPSSQAPIGIASQIPPMMETALEPVGDEAYPNPTPLVDASRSDPPYNHNSYPGFDQTSYYVGTTTPLDAMNIQQQSENVSPNPMDPNWGGAGYTQDLINKGYYKQNEVSLYVS